jgi:hypothetical protein
MVLRFLRSSSHLGRSNSSTSCATRICGLVLLVVSLTSSGHWVPCLHAATLVRTRRKGSATDAKNESEQNPGTSDARTRALSRGNPHAALEKGAIWVRCCVSCMLTCAPKSYQCSEELKVQWCFAPFSCHSLEWTYRRGAPAQTPRPKV